MADDASPAGDKYILQRNDSEFERLNLQHKYLTKTVFDGRLIFDKRISLSKESCVLDSGTGTGIWAIDLADQVPDITEIHACDVSKASFSPSPPKNVHFSLTSITSLPSEWSNKFDFVNQRLLFAALPAKDWPVALSEIYRVLKPGGAIQLIEVDPSLPTPETPVMVEVRNAMLRVFKSLGLKYDAAITVSKMLGAIGFVNIFDEMRRLPLGKSWGEIGMQGTKAFAGGLRNISGAMIKVGAASSKEGYEDLMNRLEDEWNIHGNNYPCYVICAQKPL